MTNPQIERMARNILHNRRSECGGCSDDLWDNVKSYKLAATSSHLYDDLISDAQAAYDASDARFVPMLVDALKAVKRHQEINVKSNTTAMMGTTWHIVSKALSQLPKEYK